MIRLLFGLALLAIGLWSFVGLAKPEHRSPWRGSKVPAGAATHLGFGLIFTVVGGILVFLDPGQDDAPVLPVLLMLLGFAIGTVGFVLDSLRERRRRQQGEDA
ncbi:MAG: hypothetical protein AAGE94_10195 [Acidobacteriota bacterium]